jgi:hypothetical protein
MRSRQLGVSGAIVAVALLLVAAVALAALALSRASRSGVQNTELAAKFATLHAAFVQFIAANGRLPCPASPVLDTGVEVTNVDGVCDATGDQGSVPWASIGARSDDAIDPWGGKVSYRVYTGTAGSLTQVGGASMIECDLVEQTPVAPTLVTTGSRGGLCSPNSNVTYRATPPGDYVTANTFLYNKGLVVTDAGADKNGIAYVLISHGPTGFGAYTATGVRKDLPNNAGEEFVNTSAAGPGVKFRLKAASSPGTDPASAVHFDDLVSYRTIDDLIRLAGQGARDWPDPTFGRRAIETAIGAPVTSGSGIGQVSVTLTGVVATGFAGSVTSELSFVEAADVSWAGIGVAGGGSALIQSSANEFLVLQFTETTNTKFAATLGDFGTYGGTFSETVAFFFFSGGIAGTNVATFGGLGCHIDGGLASFSMDVGAAYDTVAIVAIPAFESGTATFSGISAFVVSDVKSCPTTDALCTTSLANAANTCPVF